MTARAWLGICGFLLAAFVLNVTTTSLGDEFSRLTVVNKTGAYLHIYIENAAHPYVAPDRRIVHTVSIRETVFVEAFYSPGQGRTAAIIDTTFTIPFTPGSAYVTGDHCSCEDPNSSVSCSDDAGVVTNPAQGGSAFWEITQDDFEG